MRRFTHVWVGLVLALYLGACSGDTSAPEVTAVVVTPTEATLVVGETATLTAVVEPLGASQLVTWSSDDPAVARVSAAGVVIAQGVGDALITATSVADAAHAGSATVSVEAARDAALVVSEVTRIVDEAAKEQLEAVDAGRGELVFSGEADASTTFEPGSILVSGISESAPYGFLRTVLDVREQDGQVVVETAPASLEDVILEGTLAIAHTLTPDDIAEVELLFDGVSVRTNALPAAEPTSLDDYRWKFTFDRARVLIDTSDEDDDDDDRDAAHLKVTLDGGIGLSLTPFMEIEFREKSLGIEEMTLGVTLEQRAELNLGVIGSASFEREVEFARMTTKPMQIMVGPVPVVYSFKLRLFIGANGTVEGKLGVEVAQTFEATLGADFERDRTPEWQNLSRFPPPVFHGPEVDFALTAKAEAYAGARLEFVLYEFVATGVGARAFGEVEVTVPGDPIWCVRAGLAADFGVGLDVPILGRVEAYSTEFAKQTNLVGCSENGPPELSISVSHEPVLLLSSAWWFQADVSDLEDGPACCAVTWRSDVDGLLGTSSAAHPRLSFAFASEGPRTVTATAVDSHGLEASATLEVDVLHLPPTITITSNTSGLRVGSTHVLSAMAHDPHRAFPDDPSGVVPCDQILWNIPGATPGFGSGCAFEVEFPHVGGFNLIVEALGLHGAVALHSQPLEVLPALENAIVIMSFDVEDPNGESVDCSSGWSGVYEDAADSAVFELSAWATDRLKRNLTYTWYQGFDHRPPPSVPVDPKDPLPPPETTPNHPAQLIGTGRSVAFDMRPAFSTRITYPMQITLVVEDGTGPYATRVRRYCNFWYTLFEAQ